MGQNFVLHNARDTPLVGFFSKLGTRTKLKLIFEELERILAGSVSAAQIRADITASNAVFLLLSRHVQALPHTRDWVVWESGVAHNRDIWVFETYSDCGKISVVTPHLRHLVVFE